MEIRVKWAAGLAIALITFGVLMRLLPHPANLAPIGAICLFGSAVLPRQYKVAWWLPLAMMIASDLVLGFYNGIVFTWLAFLLVGVYGLSLRGRSNWFRVPAGALGSAVIFFVISNFGVWAQGQMYAHTWSGLVQCYHMALPFFRNTFFGDFAYGWLLFGAYALGLRIITARTSLTSTSHSQQ